MMQISLSHLAQNDSVSWVHENIGSHSKFYEPHHFLLYGIQNILTTMLFTMNEH